MKAILKRRSALEQSIQATFSVYGRWSPFKVALSGSSFEAEKDFFLKKGTPEDQIYTCSLPELDAVLTEHSPDIILLQLNDNDTQGSYAKYLQILHKLRDTTEKRRVIFIESNILGYSNPQEVKDPDATVKSVYIDILNALENSLGKDYVQFHEKLIREIPDEDYEQRLCYIFENDDVQKNIKEDDIAKLFNEALKLSLIQSHSSKTFESGFIAGNEIEMEKLQQLLKPKSKWEEFKKDFPETKENELRYHNIHPDQSDADIPTLQAEIWSELEELAGSFFDYHCSKAFNRLSSDDKVDLTEDSKYEKKQAAPSVEQPDLSANFRKFELQGNSLNSLMGQGGLNQPNLQMPLGTPPAPTQLEEKHKLNEYGDIMLAMIAAWHRQCVYVGGALYEYGYYNNHKDYILGSIVVLDRDEKLLKHVNSMSESIGLPKVNKKLDADKVLELFFKFERNYINFYEKVRSQLKLSLSFHLGEILTEDYEAEKKAKEDAENKFAVDLEQRRLRELKQAKQAEASFKARLGLLKNLKSSKAKTKEAQKEEIKEQIEEIPELNLSEEEKENLTENLEFKRLELEEKIEQERQRREDLENEIIKEQEVRDQKRKEIEEQRKKQQELEKAERLKRQQRLIEERKKREEVKKMRAKNLREAFEKARENAIKKQEVKASSPNAGKGGADKKQEKKKYNPEAVKMMIRFGTEDKKIISSTGIDAEDLAELRQVVSEEDQQLTQ